MTKDEAQAFIQLFHIARRAIDAGRAADYEEMDPPAIREASWQLTTVREGFLRRAQCPVCSHALAAHVMTRNGHDHTCNGSNADVSACSCSATEFQL